MVKSITLRGAVGILAVAVIAGCGATPSQPEGAKMEMLRVEVRDTVADYVTRDPGLEKFFKNSYAYAVFPEIGSAAVGVGGAYGKGLVLRGHQVIGLSDVSKGDIGLQLGAQRYSQIVFFEKESSFIDWRDGKFAFDAKVSAVAASAGASGSADYERGVVVFTKTVGGLMASAAVGGQKFRYTAVDKPYTLAGLPSSVLNK